MKTVNELTIACAVLILAAVSFVPASAAPTVKIFDRVGNDVSAQTLIDSDNIHIVVESDIEMESYDYKYAIQSTEPTTQEWDAVTSGGVFFEDLYFYRESQNQWVRVQVEDVLSSITTKVCGVESGTLTAPPDDSISPWDYHDMMGIGFDTSYANGNPSNNLEFSEHLIKRAGFGFLRHRINKPGDSNDWDAQFDLVEEVVKRSLRHGVPCDISLSCGWGMSSPVTEAQMEVFADYWEAASQRFKYYSHLFAFELCTETTDHFSNDDEIMQDFEDAVMPGIRQYNPTRIVIHSPATHTPYGLEGYSLRSPHRTYGIVQCHKFAGGYRRSPALSQWTYGTSVQKQNLIDLFDIIEDYIDGENVPVYWGAFMPWGKNASDVHTVAQTAEIAGFFTDLAREYDVPAGFNKAGDFLSSGTASWNPDYMAIIEAMNGAASYDPADSDGDGLTDAYELAYSGGPLNPFECDTDTDGMTDKEEIDFSFNPLLTSDGASDLDIYGIPHGASSDADSDGIPNIFEIYYGNFSCKAQASWPFDPNDDSDGTEDYDSDGMNNTKEVEWCLYSPLNSKKSEDYSNASAMDIDNLDAYEEIDDGTHPWLADTDGDSIQDDIDPTPTPLAELENGGAPAFNADPFSKEDAIATEAYSASIVNDVTDPDGRGHSPLTFSKTNGPAWLSVSSFGVLTGTPGSGDAGLTTFTVRVEDGFEAYDTASMRINVVTSDTTAPANPTGLDATAGDEQVSLGWNDNSEGDLDGYNVYRSTTTGSGFSKINGSLVSASAYTDSTVTNDTTYYYVVSAVDTSSNESGYSNEVSAMPEAGGDPVATLTDDAFGQKNNGDTNYGDSIKLILRDPESTFSRISFMKFEVTGVSGTVSSAILKLYSEVGDNGQDGTVYAKEVSDTSWTEETLTWNNMPDRGSTIDTEVMSPGTWSEFDVTDYITADGTYSIGLETPVNAVGKLHSKENESNNPELIITCGSPDTTAPGNPTGLAATAGEAEVDLDWNDNTEGDLDGYNVYRSTTTGSGYAKINGTLVESSLYNDDTVSNDTTYYFVVTAVDTSSNESDYSNEDSAMPEAPEATLTDDAFGQKNNGDTNYGDDIKLLLRDPESTFSRISFMKFEVTGVSGTVSSAILRLYSEVGDNGQDGTVYVKEVSSTSWAEETLTWNNMPDRQSIIDTEVMSPGTWSEFDVTDYITANGTYSIGLETPVNAVGKLHSKENESNNPELIITTE